jgi:hypothetical protein
MQNIQDVETLSLGYQIKDKLSKLSKTDGLKRTQRWLATQAKLGEVELSNKMNGNTDFTQDELNEINRVLDTNFTITA